MGLEDVEMAQHLVPVRKRESEGWLVDLRYRAQMREMST